MIATLDFLFDGPIHCPEPITKTTARASKGHDHHRVSQAAPTDIKAWLRDNRPQDSAELADLRQALYTRKTKGDFIVHLQSPTRMGEERFVVTGRASDLLIVSDKARHLLLRSLCRIRRSDGL